MINYHDKYLKYKQKYTDLKNKIGGGKCFEYGLQQHLGECWHDAITMMLFQSDITNSKDEFLSITDDKIHTQYFKLLELFSPENIERNAYKLPTDVYIYYLKNSSSPDINDKIQTFLDLTKSYMFSQVKRIQNRLKLDTPRYNPDYLLTSFTEGKKLFEEDLIENIKRDADRNKAQFRQFLIDNPTYPNRDDILKKLSMTKEEEEEYKKTPEYEAEMQKFKEFVDTKYREKQEFTKQIEQFVPKKEKLARRTSIRKSIECSLIIGKITKLFNLSEEEMTKLSHGGTKSQSNLAYEIHNLYLNDSYYIYVDHIFLYDINNYDLLLKNLEDPNLIGLHGGIKFPNGSHAISFYTCDKHEILYDDNLSKPVFSSWKKSLKKKLRNIRNRKDEKIYYYDNYNVLQSFTLNDIEPNKVEEFLESGIMEDYEKKRQLFLEQISLNPHLQMVNIPTFEEYSKTYILSKIGIINSLGIVVKKEKSKSEEEHIINNILTKTFINSEDIKFIVDKLSSIKNINITRKGLVKLIDFILQSNIYVNLYVIYYLCQKIDELTPDDLISNNKIRIKILHKYPQILKRFNKYYNIVERTYIVIYILFLNSAQSEYVLEYLLSDVTKEFLEENLLNKEFVEKHNMYVWDGRKFIEKPIKEIMKIIKLTNVTNKPYKQKLIDILEQYALSD